MGSDHYEKGQPLKILILTKYPMRGPSSRYRFYQFLPALQEAGIEVHIQPFFTDAYLDLLFSGKKPNPVYLASRCFARLAQTLGGKGFDLAWVEGELLPYIPAFLERWLHLPLPKARIYEFDDANWLRYQGKSLFENKFAAILQSAAGIVVGNQFLEDYVQKYNPNTTIIPTVVDWNRYKDCKPQLSGHTIGWIGSQNTAFFLDDIFPALRELSQELPLKLKVVGAEVEAKGVDIECVKWTADTEISHLDSFDVGVMPLEDTPWARGKCGLKLIQYLAAGVPAVASGVGVNTSYIHDSGGGYVAEDTQSWVFNLRKLLTNQDLRRQMGEKGQDWARDTMTIHTQAPRLIEFLKQAG